jgi:hypothetical protein
MKRFLSISDQQDTKKSSVLVPDHNAQSPFFKPIIQAKLAVNQPGDSYEQEADAMADKVMNSGRNPSNQNYFFKPSSSNVQRKCASCEKEEKELHRKESSSGNITTPSQTENYIESLNSKGRNLTSSERDFFEPKFGRDFSDVRIHTDSQANKSAQSIQARAYTHGNNIVFANNQYEPSTDSGKKLLAHELTHVVQQNSVLQRKIIQRFPWPYPLHMNREVDENVTETISSAPAAFAAWNGTFNWQSRFRIQLNAMIGEIWLVMRLSSTAPKNLQRVWERAIYNKWSGNKYLKITIPGLTQGPCKFLIRVDLRWVADPAKAHYTITPKAPGDVCGAGIAGLGGTCSMTDWGTADNTDITHEFGHMIGNKEEYFTTDGQNFATGGKVGFRDPGGGVMNNPAERARLRHFNLLKHQVADMLRLKHSDVAVMFDDASIENCIADVGDFPQPASKQDMVAV